MSGEGPVEAGSGGPTLTCTVHETISGLTNMPSAIWVGPFGPVEDGESVTLTGTISNVTATLTLTFHSLLTSQAGGYTCQGTVVTPAGVDDVTITSTPPHYVTVSCKYCRLNASMHHSLSLLVPASSLLLSLLMNDHLYLFLYVPISVTLSQFPLHLCLSVFPVFHCMRVSLKF